MKGCGIRPAQAPLLPFNGMELPYRQVTKLQGKICVVLRKGEGLLNGTERAEAPPQINPFAKVAVESAAAGLGQKEKQPEML